MTLKELIRMNISPSTGSMRTIVKHIDHYSAVYSIHITTHTFEIGFYIRNNRTGRLLRTGL